jgi:hypothetical protein
VTHPRFVYLAAALLVLLTGAAASASGPAVAKCTSLEGTVIGYDPDASTSCSPHAAQVHQDLFARETLRSNGGGDLTFDTNHLHKCIQFATLNGTRDILRPKPGVALRHLRGVTYCRHVTGDAGSRSLTTPGAVIRLHGTMFALASDGKNSTIKVAHGRIRARSTFDQRIVTITAGYKAYFPANAPPSQPRTFKGTRRDAEAFALLSVDAAPAGVDEIAQGLNDVGIHTAVVVAFDNATLNAERSALGNDGIKVGLLLASRLKKQPSILTTTATKFHTTAVVVAAPVAKAKLLLDTVHQDDTNHDLTIYFVDTTPTP